MLYKIKSLVVNLLSYVALSATFEVHLEYKLLNIAFLYDKCYLSKSIWRIYNFCADIKTHSITTLTLNIE